MSDHQIKIMVGGGIDPPTLKGVKALDAVTIGNRSGTGVTITYVAGANPFSDVEDGRKESLSDGSDTTHTISGDFDTSVVYDLWVELEASLLQTSPKIRITDSKR